MSVAVCRTQSCFCTVSNKAAGFTRFCKAQTRADCSAFMYVFHYVQYHMKLDFADIFTTIMLQERDSQKVQSEVLFRTHCSGSEPLCDVTSGTETGQYLHPSAKESMGFYVLHAVIKLNTSIVSLKVRSRRTLTS